MHFMDMQCISPLFHIYLVPPLHTFQQTSCYSFFGPSFIYTLLTERWLLLEVVLWISSRCQSSDCSVLATRLTAFI